MSLQSQLVRCCRGISYSVIKTKTVGSENKTNRNLHIFAEANHSKTGQREINCVSELTGEKGTCLLQLSISKLFTTKSTNKIKITRTEGRKEKEKEREVSCTAICFNGATKFSNDRACTRASEKNVECIITRLAIIIVIANSCATVVFCPIETRIRQKRGKGRG